MKEYVRVILVLMLLATGVVIGYFFPRKSYVVVKQNWIRTQNASFTVEARDVSCERFTISVLGFFAAAIAEDVAKSSETYLQLHSGLKLEAEYPIEFTELEENMAPFGFYANYHDTIFSAKPSLVEGEKYNVTVRVTFSRFAEIHDTVPFRLELIPTQCQ